MPPSVCREKWLAPGEREPAGSSAAAQQQAEPFVAGRQAGARVLPALCLHMGVPACCAPSASPGWPPLARNDCGMWKNKRGHVVAQPRPRGGCFWDARGEDGMGMRMGMRTGSLAAPLGATTCWHLVAAGQEVRGSAVLPGLVLPFHHAETLPKPTSIGISGRGTGRLPPGERGNAVPRGSGGSAGPGVPPRGVLSPALRRMDVTGSLLGISPVKRESRSEREVAGWRGACRGAAGRVPSKHGIPWAAGCR